MQKYNIGIIDVHKTIALHIRLYLLYTIFSTEKIRSKCLGSLIKKKIKIFTILHVVYYAM
jgi:hypothetical protein